MYRDYHHSETIEVIFTFISDVRHSHHEQPRMYERRPSFEESDSDPEEYRYVVPSGVHVVFRDHDGNEIARFVVKFGEKTWTNGDHRIGEPGSISEGRPKRDMTAFTVQDEHGNILYR
jgi:hypothetical protein